MKILKIVGKCTLCLLFTVVACILGFFAGSEINKKFFKVDKYSNLVREEFMDDISNLNYEGKSPEDFTPTEVFLLALEHTSATDYDRIILGTLDISIGVTQNIEVLTTKRGDEYSFASNTYSPVFKSAIRSTFKKNEDIHVEKGTVSTPYLKDVVWTDKYDTYSYDDYTKLLGRDVTYECQYIVSSKTVTDSCLIKEENGLYTYKIVLDPFYSTFTYVNEIAHNSGVDKHTVSFNSVEFEFVVDNNFYLISQFSTEKYTLKYGGIPVSITATYNNTITH